MKQITVELPDNEPSVGDIIVVEGSQYRIHTIVSHIYRVDGKDAQYTDARSVYHIERISDSKRAKARLLPTGAFFIV